MMKAVSHITIHFSIIFFQKITLKLPVTKQKSIIRTLRKKLGKRVKHDYDAAFSHLVKKVIPHRSKISNNKESENKKLPSTWTSFA